MGNAGRHLTDRSKAIRPFHLLIVILLQFDLGLFEVVDHGVEAPHQLTDFIAITRIETDRKIAAFNFCHLFGHLLNRLADKTEENEGDAEGKDCDQYEHRRERNIGRLMQPLDRLFQVKIHIEDTDDPAPDAVAKIAAFIGHNRENDGQGFATIDAKLPFGFSLPEEFIVGRIDKLADFIRVGRLENCAVGMKNAQIEETFALADDFNNLLNLRTVAILHGSEDRFFDSGKEKICRLLVRFDEMNLLPSDIDQRKDADTDRHQQDIKKDNPDDQTFIQQSDLLNPGSIDRGTNHFLFSSPTMYERIISSRLSPAGMGEGAGCFFSGGRCGKENGAEVVVTGGAGGEEGIAGATADGETASGGGMTGTIFTVAGEGKSVTLRPGGVKPRSSSKSPFFNNRSISRCCDFINSSTTTSRLSTLMISA